MSPPLSDPTFSNYSHNQAQQYANSRLSYSAQLYNTILNYHTETHGQVNVLADIGCGPGNATRDLAMLFDHAIGLDPSVEMINTALLSDGLTRAGRPLAYAVSTSDNIVHGITEALPAAKENGGVDLLTAAMAAHWFDMPKFWKEASRIVKSQGTVALWTCASLYCHPSTVNAKEVQQALFHLEREVLSPYELPPNRVSRDLYENLVLPWHTGDDNVAKEFPIAEFRRMEWDRDGILTDEKQFFNFSQDKTLNDLETSLGTASMVTRWREAHPELVGTKKDCVRQMIAQVRTALGAGEEENPTITVGTAVVILLFKRK
ncbi:hypothetical protein N7474_009284 [Penicillium riverlandense]|uniref:uncharacterized protein n=1 Tax=Penicillium riverlandense TaxID=1903569 RepID=UPI0025482692|nr:uncharacterized protein N7474_009284 [Penicillium riverlandense]KAJ5808015.1 hypothetical protein N7474_009284 [Penicillium riverlandense]